MCDESPRIKVSDSFERTDDAGGISREFDVQDAHVADDLKREQSSNDLLEEATEGLLESKHGDHHDLHGAVDFGGSENHIRCGLVVRHLSWDTHLDIHAVNTQALSGCLRCEEGRVCEVD